MLSDAELADYHQFKSHSTQTKARIRGALRHWRKTGCEPTSKGFATYRDTRLASGAAPATVRGEMNKLLALARWLGHSPAVKLPTSPHRCPVAWTRSELRALITAAKRTKRTIWGVPGRVFWPALIHVAMDSGQRIGALTAVRWADIDLRRRVVLFPAEICKGGYADSMAVLSRQSSKSLSQLHLRRCSTPSERVFCYGSPSTLWKSYNKLLVEANLPTDRRSKFHRLRRTVATEAYLRGEDATAIMGHSSDAITRKSYIDWSRVQRRKTWWGWLTG